MKSIKANNAYSAIMDFLENTKFKAKTNLNKILLYAFLIGIGGLVLKIFDFITLFYIGIILVSLSFFVYFKLKEINKAGIINYLPRALKNAMLRRSIFDILMDIWYLPTLSLYINLFIKPFFTKINPMEATKLLEDFDSDQRKTFLTKGIINIFPKKVKTLLLPTDNKANNEIDITGKNSIAEENHSDSTRSDIIAQDNSKSVMVFSSPQNVKQIQNIIKKNKKHLVPFILDKSGKLLLGSLPEKRFKIHRRRKNSRISAQSIISSLNNSKYEFIVERKISLNSSTHAISNKNIVEINDEANEMEVPLINDNCDFLNNPLESSRENKIVKAEKEPNPSSLHKKDDLRFYEIDDDVEGKKLYTTVVLESSEKMKSKIDRAASSDSLKDLNNFHWDNLNRYYDQEAKKALRGNKTTKSNFIKIFMQSLRQQIMSKIDVNKLSKAFGIFCLTLLVQIIISKKARRWSISVIQFLLYVVTSLGAGGTLYFLLLKKKN